MYWSVEMLFFHLFEVTAGLYQDVQATNLIFHFKISVFCQLLKCTAFAETLFHSDL